MSDTAPVPVHLAAALEGLAENPALPAELSRRLLAYRKGFGHVAKRSDLTADLIAEILNTDYHWLLHSLALNRHLPNDARFRLAEHRDSSIRAALVVGADDAPRELFARLIDDPDKLVRQHLAEKDHVPTDLRARVLAPRDPDLPAGPAERLAADPEISVRRAIASHPRLPTRTLIALLADQSESVTQAAAASPSLPVTEMERLLVLAGL